MSETARSGGKRQGATKRSTSTGKERELSTTQLTALTTLATGATVTLAAAEAGIDRTTIHRWLRDDHTFQAAWNRIRRDREREALARIEHLAIGALDAVEQAVLGGDARVSLAVLRGVGLLGGKRASIGSEDSATVARDAELAENEESKELRMRSLFASLF